MTAELSSMLPILLVALGLLVLLMVAAAALAAWRRSAPLAAAERHELHRRLEHSRLARMLQRLHVSQDTYLRRVRPAEVRAQLDGCAGCAHQARCDRALSCKRNVGEDLSFCPNHDCIVALKRAA